MLSGSKGQTNSPPRHVEILARRGKEKARQANARRARFTRWEARGMSAQPISIGSAFPKRPLCSMRRGCHAVSSREDGKRWTPTRVVDLDAIHAEPPSLVPSNQG